MNRIELIKEIFSVTNFRYYLEIGCHAGRSFLPVKARHKIAVDPSFKIPRLRKLVWLLKVPSNINNRYFEETSDDFFSKRKNIIGQLDVVLVDGLHTYRGALSDVLNSLKFLNTKGIIIMHDCFPPHKAAALSTTNYPTEEERNGVEGWNGQWCGDVWKSIVYLKRKLAASVDVCVIHTDYGLGIVRIKGKIDPLKLVIDEKLFSEIDHLTYDFLIENQQATIDLKRPEYAQKLILEMAGAKN